MKKKTAFYCIQIILMLTAVLFIGCATSSKTIRGMHPANVDLQGAKSISVTQFSIDTESVNFTADSLLPSDAEKASEYLYSCLTKDIEESKYLKLRTSKSDVSLSGQITDLSSETVTDSSGADFVRKVYMTVTYEIVSNKTQTVIASRRAAISAASDVAKTEALLPSVYDVIEPQIPRLALTIVKDLQPYPIVRRISLIKPKFNFDMQYAYSLFKKGEYSRAKDSYLAIYSDTELFDAGYNAVRIMQIKGELAEARLLVIDLFKNSKDKRAAEVLHEIEEEMANTAKNKNESK